MDSGGEKARDDDASILVQMRVKVYHLCKCRDALSGCRRLAQVVYATVLAPIHAHYCPNAEHPSTQLG